MKVEQFVMAYKAEQDRLRAMLPEGFESLRPVLRINAEIRDDKDIYLEFNTPVATRGKRGWLNIANWQTIQVPQDLQAMHELQSALADERNGSAVTFCSPFIEITYTGVGIEGRCPAEGDNEGCFFLDENPNFRPKELISSNREFCDCQFKWNFTETSTGGISVGGKSVPEFPTECEVQYPKQPLTAENAAEIECQQVLGSYKVIFGRL